MKLLKLLLLLRVKEQMLATLVIRQAASGTKKGSTSW